LRTCFLKKAGKENEMTMPVLLSALAILGVLYFAAPYLVDFYISRRQPRPSNATRQSSASPPGASTAPRLSASESRRNALISCGELLACTLLHQVAVQIEKDQRTDKFEVEYYPEASDKVLRMAILILKNSGWEARDAGDNKLVLTHFDPYDVDRLFILQGRDKAELEEARRPTGYIPRLWTFEELKKKLDHEAISNNIAARVIAYATERQADAI